MKKTSGIQKLRRKLTALALAGILACNPFHYIVAQAAVTDNLGTVAIEQTIGSWEDSKDTHSVIGLLRLIIDKIFDSMQKIDTMQEKVETMSSQINTMSGQMQTVNSKIDQQTLALTGTIENTLKKATAAYSLFVYLPKSQAASGYAGQTVTLASSSGNQSVTGALTDDGTNYSVRLYFDFGGACVLYYNFTNSDGIQYSASKGITITQTGQEVHLTECSSVNIDLKIQSWKTIHELCRAGIGFGYGYINQGTELPDGWYVIGGDAYHLRIWRKSSIGKMEWSDANNAAQSYYDTFNTQFANYAYASAMLSRTDVESDWFVNNRAFGINYWLETLHSGNSSYYVYGMYGDNLVTYRFIDNGDEIECCPAVWIH